MDNVIPATTKREGCASGRRTEGALVRRGHNRLSEQERRAQARRIARFSHEGWGNRGSGRTSEGGDSARGSDRGGRRLRRGDALAVGGRRTLTREVELSDAVACKLPDSPVPVIEPLCRTGPSPEDRPLILPRHAPTPTGCNRLDEGP